MIIGIIKSINPNGTSGTVQPENYDSTFTFSDNNFPSTGLQVDDECKFDLPCFDPDCIATNLQSINTNQTVIKDIVTGDQNVGQDEILTIKTGGTVNGNITISGGIVKLNGGEINGDVNSAGGGSLVVKNSGATLGKFTGDYNGSNSMLRINGGIVTGNISISNGSVAKVRTGGQLNGNISISDNSRVRLKNGGTQNGNINVIDNESTFTKEIGGELNGNISISNGSKVKVSKS